MSFSEQMRLKEQEYVNLLEKQKKALIAYIEMCIFIKDLPRTEVMLMVTENEDIEHLQKCIEMFEETKVKYTKAIKDV